MDLWNKARSFAEEAAKRSQELTKEAARRSSDLTVGSSKLSDFVSDASKRSKEIAAEASKRAELLRAEAAKRADQIKSLAENMAPSGALALRDITAANDTQQQQREKDLESFGVTEELREFVKEITVTTFQDFPLEGTFFHYCLCTFIYFVYVFNKNDSLICDVPTVSNVRKDLNEWQEKHASLVLSTVKITFGTYEKRYMEEDKLKSSKQIKDVAKVPSKVGIIHNSEVKESNQHGKTSTSSAREQDLDVFLLGGDSDEDPGTPILISLTC
ncbi:hypothetical protein JRO89_XS13G0004500 [Xanthoceras sorbifolium]|uniref:BSD domain-containing protein n=1 Tax=Xanthoceras sorbifolium TaxID=99658 RepID=A0ABQ8H5Q4_9ROSI|nr:hypothetical protein JRO89_XS13G0004500 [Xanthoceras sorbifolium]